MQLHPIMSNTHTTLAFLHICNSLESDIARTEARLHAANLGIAGYWMFMHWDIIVIYLPFFWTLPLYSTYPSHYSVSVLPRQIWNKCTARNVCTLWKKASGLKRARPHWPTEQCVWLSRIDNNHLNWKSNKRETVQLQMFTLALQNWATLRKQCVWGKPFIEKWIHRFNLLLPESTGQLPSTRYTTPT